MLENQSKHKTYCEVIYTLIVMYIVYITDSLLFGTNRQYIFIQIKRYSVVVFAVLLLVKKNSTRNQQYNSQIVLVTFFLLLSMVFAGEIIGHFYFSQIACFIFGMCLSLYISMEKFTEHYIKLMRVIAIVSLIAFALSSQLRLLSFIPKIINTVNRPFYFLFFTNVPQDVGLAVRNWGPFWEPGAYQMYLNMAFYLTLFTNGSKHRLFDSLLFAITCVTTRSGASFVGLAFIMAAYIYDRNKALKKSKKAIILFVSLSCVYLLSTDMFIRAFEKTMLGFNSSDPTSFGIRLASALALIKSFLLSPIWGNSANTIMRITDEYTVLLSDWEAGSFTNTFLGYYAYFGAYIGTFAVTNLYKTVRQLSSSWIVAMLAFGGFIASTSNENFMSSLLLCCFIFLRTRDSSNPCNNKPKKPIENERVI